MQGKRFEDHPVWKNLGWKKGKVFIHGAGEAGQKACQCLSAPPAGFLDMNDALDEVNGIKVYTSKLWSKIISNDDIVLITPVMDYEGIAEHVKTARRGAQCIFVGEFVDFI